MTITQPDRYRQLQRTLSRLSERELLEAVGESELPPLMVALYCATGDDALIHPSLAPAAKQAALGTERNGGMTAEAQQAACQLSLEVLHALRDGRITPSPVPDTDRARDQILKYLTGGAAGPEYGDLMRHEIGLANRPAMRPQDRSQIAPEKGFRVAVIGAGMSGLGAAYRLQEAGIEYVVFEKESGVGGTWRNNTYPGCRLDTSNFGYSYSFAQKSDWADWYSPQTELLDYFSSFASSREIEQHVRFNTEVHSLEYDEGAAHWRVVFSSQAGCVEEQRFEAVICAMGQLNRPKIPNIAGLDGFGGRFWHSAEWDHDFEIDGADVSIVGTGASGFQIIPAIAERVNSLTVFQRNPPWVLPTPLYHEKIPTGMRTLLDVIPDYHRWLRFSQFWSSDVGRRPFVLVDPDWTHPFSVSAENEHLRQELETYLRNQFTDSAIAEKLIPKYPPGAKRMLRDNGVWAKTFQRQNVRLVQEGILKVTQRGIESDSGEVHESDAIIFATGFKASEFLAPVEVVGKDGRRLHEVWGDDPRAYLGVHVPGFPNLFLVYGPNTNLVVNGSTVLFSECAVDLIMSSLEYILLNGVRAVEVRAEVLADYYRRVDQANGRVAWGTSGVESWYKNVKGRVTQNWPFETYEYWRCTRGFDPSLYIIDSAQDA